MASIAHRCKLWNGQRYLHDKATEFSFRKSGQQPCPKFEGGQCDPVCGWSAPFRNNSSNVNKGRIGAEAETGAWLVWGQPGLVSIEILPQHTSKAAKLWGAMSSVLLLFLPSLSHSRDLEFQLSDQRATLTCLLSAFFFFQEFKAVYQKHNKISSLPRRLGMSFLLQHSAIPVTTKVLAIPFMAKRDLAQGKRWRPT